jgi:hypothetical protein
MPYGTLALDAISTSGNLTVAGNLTVSGTVASATGTTYPLVSGTAQATTSGTSIDFTGIPSWVKRITVMLNAVSTSGSSFVQLQLGSGTYTTSGYNATHGNFTSGSTSAAAIATGFGQSSGASAGDSRFGAFVLTHMGSNIWVCNGQFSVGTYLTYGSGAVTLSGVLDRVRLTTVNGTDTFDAGSVNILYE